MKHLRNATFAALLLGTTVRASALADNPIATGCRPAVARAEAEGGGVGTVNSANSQGGSGGRRSWKRQRCDPQGRSRRRRSRFR